MLQKSSQYWIRVILFVLLILLIFTIKSAVFPFLVALILAFILAPLVDGIETASKKRLKLRNFPRWVGILLAFIIFACISALIITHILLPFTAELSVFIHNIPWFLQQFGSVLWTFQHEHLNVPITPQVEFLINEGLVKLGNYSVEVARQSLSAVLSFAGILIELFLVPILCFYMLKDGKKIRQRFIDMFAMESQNGVSAMLTAMQTTLGGYLRGQLILATNMFVIVFVAMSFFSVPYPLVLSLLAAIAEWIPIIGPILGAMPAIILALLIDPGLAVKVALFYLIIQFVDAQIIMPKVMGSVISLHPIVIIGAIFIGGSLYGMSGMIFAVPLTALLQILVKYLWYFEKKFKGKGDLV